MTDQPALPVIPLEALQAMHAAVEARPRPVTKEFIDAELSRCAVDPAYFVNTYCKIYDNDSQSWIPFKLWPFQERALRVICEVDDANHAVYKRLVTLKTRQIGFTWLFGPAHKLWKMRFRPITEVLVFSQSDEDAMAVLSEQRLKGTYSQLPEWMKIEVTTDSAHEFRLDNGSGIRALPESRGGDSRTVTDVFIDEADLITDLTNLIARAEPTLGLNGQMIVNGRAVKEKPNSAFKRLYLSAKSAEVEGKDAKWNKAIFVPWYDHPGRTAKWKAQLDAETMGRDFTLDYVHEHYPSTDIEALSARTLDKRYAPAKIAALTKELPPIATGLDIPGLRVYVLPEPGRRYGEGADPAGGLPNGDDSYLQVIDAESYEQCAAVQGKIEPEKLADAAKALSDYFYGARCLFELNNHGHAFLLQARRNGLPLEMGLTRRGEKERRPGWLTTQPSKNTLYDGGADILNHVIAETMDESEILHPELARAIIHDPVTAMQLSIIDKDELEAPEGDHDDAAMSWVLAVRSVYVGSPSMELSPHNLWTQGRMTVPPPSVTHPSLGAPLPEKQSFATYDDKVREKLIARGIKLSR